MAAVAYQAEHKRARRLAQRTGLSETAALQHILEQVAGAQGLAALFAARAAQALHVASSRAARQSISAHKRAQQSASRQSSPLAWRAWFDGATNPNPGNMGIGGLLIGPDGERIEISHAAGHGDSSEAEYQALICVLEAAIRIGPDQLIIYGDSQVVINDVNQVCRITVPDLQIYSQRAAELLAQLPAVTVTWSPRARNVAADLLSQQALGLNGKSIAPTPQRTYHDPFFA